MVDEGGRRARIAQAVTGLDRLEREISAWLQIRRQRDRLQQYATPLTTLERTLLGAVGGLRAEVAGIPRDQPLGVVHARCRRADRQAALVRQVWDWLRTKFDQRDDDGLKGVLAAADEVVWSCYQEAVATAELRGVGADDRWPVPLPYIDAGGAVEAFVRDEPPRGLAPAADQPAVRDFLATLPVPVISLPAACLDAPWWLALIAHEVGHHLQYDLAADAALIREVGEVIEQAAGGEPATAARWRSWSEEIFADACAVASTGTAAVTAILQLELDTEERLLAGRRQGRRAYPPPVVRLALLAEMAEQLGLDGRAALDGVDPEALVAARNEDSAEVAKVRATARAYLAQVGKVAAAVLAAPLGGAGPLADLFHLRPADHRPGGRVAEWADTLQRGTARPEPSLRAAREQIGGAVRAWRRIIDTAEDAERTQELEALAAALPRLVVASRKPGTRAVAREAGPQDFSAALTAAVRETLDEAEGSAPPPDPVGG